MSAYSPSPKGIRRKAFFALCSGLLTLGAAGMLGACSNASKPSPGQDEKSVVVFAATSLRDVFTSLGASFKQSHPGVEMTFHFGGTQELRTQLEHGADADVFASADQQHMDELLKAKRIEEPVVFARNEPVWVVSKEASGLIRQFADLPKADRIVLGGPEVPIGRYAQQILERAGPSLGADFKARVEAKVVSRESNVRQVLAKVSLGEAQAGLVYQSDALHAQDKVTVVRIPPEINVLATYPIAMTSEAKHPALARAWIAWVRSPEAKKALEQAGFIVEGAPVP